MSTITIIHWQLPDKSLACGEDHVDGRSSLREMCCALNAAHVSCTACRAVIGHRVLSRLPEDQPDIPIVVRHMTARLGAMI